ncbi:Rad17-domain-containing protein [Tothia fuscella]|uniref:Rad17-domain-containing protein n=1 Tax=Tothia fuscella TaxID=1048955 RepID=A0A9P4NWI1_9PEZI|nr:Rad17-domain-containing protein [Tothia fuscella]
MGRLRPPKKKPVVVIPSDDEDEVAPPKSIPIKPRSKRKDAEKKNDDTKASKASPKLTRSRLTAPQKGSQTSKASPSRPDRTINSFFSAAILQKQSQHAISPEKANGNAIEIEEDLIEDDDSFDDELMKLSQTKFGSKYPLPTRKKRKLEEEGSTDSSGLPRGSQLFKKSALSSHRFSDKPSIQQDLRPWTEKYGPVNMEELAVHKKKVQDVRTWLDSVMSGRDRKRLLILKGAAGTGKTTTIRLLSQNLNFGINEWRNPGVSTGEDKLASMSAQFEEFVARTETFGVLDIGTSDGNSDSQVLANQDQGNRIILVEEFPNTFQKSASGPTAFRAAVMQYLESSTPSMDTLFSRQSASQKPITPIVMIISETLISTATASADSFTTYRLLGTEITNHPGTTVIEFNPIAQTFMSKALELVIRKESRESGRRKAPGTSVLKHLSEAGDIRSAISTLEFLCLRGGGDEDWSGKVKFTKTKRASTDAPMSKMETDSLEIITQRESTLGIFHAVGKVVYNKRELHPATDTAPPQPPTHLPQHARPKISEVNVDTLINELGTEISTFIATLHENYVLSCQGLDSEETLEHINGCIDALSDADLLSPDRFNNNTNRITYQGTAGDNLRQDEILFHTAVRGMLFNLPHPVKRIAPPPGLRNTRGAASVGGSGIAYKMYYPVSERLWRRKEEIGGMIDSVVGKIQNGQLWAASKEAASSSTTLTGVEAWRKNRFADTSKTPANAGTPTKTDDNTAYPTALLGTGSSAKVEMLLETLPYMYAIQKRKTNLGFNNSFKDIEKITKVSGNSRPLDAEDEEDDEEEVEIGAEEQWSTDKPDDVTKSPKKKKFGLVGKKDDVEGVMKGKMEGLVLEDDDIEDD